MVALGLQTSFLKAQKNNGMQSQKAIIGIRASRLIARLLVPTEQYKNRQKRRIQMNKGMIVPFRCKIIKSLIF